MKTKHTFTIPRVSHTYAKVRLKAAPHSGVHSEPKSTRRWSAEVDVELTIDLETLSKLMATRAVHSKSGVSSYQDGLIKCRVLRQDEHDVTVTDHALPDNYELAA